MTRPIYEPNTQREIRRQGWGQDQLFRRPAPTAAAAAAVYIEWVRLQATNDWSDADYTIIEWNSINGYWDQDTPTFAINASDNLEIMKEGFYTFVCEIANVNIDGTKWAHVETLSSVISGPSPDIAWQGWTTSPTEFNWLVEYFVPGSPLTPNVPVQFYAAAAWEDGTFAGTPAELQLRGLLSWDGAPVVSTSVIPRMLVIRHGTNYPPP